MNLVSFVFQDSFLFFDTLYENIRVGNTSATREQVTKLPARLNVTIL